MIQGQATRSEGIFCPPSSGADSPAAGSRTLAPTTGTARGFLSTVGAALRRLVRGQLSLDDVWLLLPWLVVPAILNASFIYPNDFWWHLRTGQIIAQTGTIPTTDLFTFTRYGLPWTNQSWLMQLAFFLLYRAGHLPLIIFAYALAVTAGYLCIQAACFLAGNRQARAATLGTMIAAVVGGAHWTIRPQFISFAFFGALVYLIEADRHGSRRSVWLLPPLFALWVNAHGGFVFGCGLLAIYCLSQVGESLLQHRPLPAGTRRLLVATAATGLALCLNPAGPVGIIHYVLGFFQSNATINANQEFQPLNIRGADGVLFTASTLVFLAVVYRRRSRLPIYTAAALLVFGLFTLYTRRVAPWYGMALGLALAEALGKATEGEASPSIKVRPNAPVLNYALVGLLALASLIALPWLRPYLPLPAAQRNYIASDETPVAAAARLCELGPSTRTFSEIAYSSYLTWACPDMPVFMDTRFELYPADMWEDHLLVVHGQFGWEKVLARYGIDAILADKKTQSMLVKAAQASPAWQTLYEDEHTILLTLSARSSVSARQIDARQS